MGPWYAAPPPAYAPSPAGYYGWMPPTHAFPDIPPRKYGSWDAAKYTDRRKMPMLRMGIWNLNINTKFTNKHADIKSTILWNMMLYGLSEVHQQFGGMYCLHFQGQTVNQAVTSKEWPSWLLNWLILQFWRWKFIPLNMECLPGYTASHLGG